MTNKPNMLSTIIGPAGETYVLANKPPVFGKLGIIDNWGDPSVAANRIRKNFIEIGGLQTEIGNYQVPIRYRFALSNNSGNGLDFHIAAASNTANSYNVAGGILGETDRVTVQYSGNVGINCNAPRHRLDVNGDMEAFVPTRTTTPTYLRIYNNQWGNNNTTDSVQCGVIELGTYYQGGPYFTSIRSCVLPGYWGDGQRLDICSPKIQNDNTQINRISVMPFTGSVGIGTSTPTQLLDVQGYIHGGTTDGWGQLTLGNGSLGLLLQRASDGLCYIRNQATNGRINIGSGGTNYHIFSNGFFGVNCTPSGSYTLEVNGTIKGTTITADNFVLTSQTI